MLITVTGVVLFGITVWVSRLACAAGMKANLHEERHRMTTTLIRNAAAIMTGGGANEPARAAGPDIRIEGTRIQAVGALAAMPGEAIVDATDCVVYPAWSTLIIICFRRC